MGPTIDDDLRHLGQLLWRTRGCLEQVEYLLDVQRLLANSAMERWLGRASDQLAGACTELDGLDHERGEVLSRVAASLGHPGPLSLSDLVRHAPQPWGEIFADHLRWFSDEVSRIADANTRARSSLREALGGVQDLLRSLHGPAASEGVYDHAGRPVVVTTGHALFFDDRA